MELRNRMMNQPPMTVEMDLLGLRRADPLRRVRPDETVLTVTDHPSQKETHAMRYDTALRLKDDSLTGPRPTQNWDEVRRLLMEAARKIDPTYSISEQEALCARLIQDMQRDTPTPRSGRDYLLKIANDSENKFRDEEHWTAASRKAVEALAVPLAKRITPGFARIY